VVFVERGQRKILVNYAKRQVGNRVYGGQSSHLPLKVNMAGVIPPIFASSIILLPATVVGWFATGDSLRWLKDIASALSPGQPIYVMLYAAARSLKNSTTGLPVSPALNQPMMVAGSRMIEEAKIGGITPAMLSLSGRCEA